MCLKTNLKARKIDLKQEIIQQGNEILNILEEGKLKENLEQFEFIKQQRLYDMSDLGARELTGLSKEEYKYIERNYTKLISKYPEVKQSVKRRLEYMKSEKIAKAIAIKGCNNCIEIVSKKLDIKIQDLCQGCQQLV